MPNPTTSGSFTRGGTSEVTLDQFNQQLRASPLWATWMAQHGIRTDKAIKLSKDQQKDFAGFLQTHGVAVPKDFHIDDGGNLNQTSRTKRNLIIAGAVAGAAFGIPAIVGAVGAAGGAGAGAYIGADVAATSSAALGGTAAGASALGAAGATAAAAAKSPSLWSKLAGPAIQAGVPAVTNLLGTKMQVNAERDAAKIQADSAREALEWQKQQYAQRQSQLAPAIGVGNGATVRLGELMGIPTPQGGYQPQTQIGAGGVPSNPVPGAQSPQPGGQPVPMRAPSGQVSLVPPDQVAHYTQKGAVVVS